MSSGGGLPPALLAWLGENAANKLKYADYVWYFIGSSLGALILLRASKLIIDRFDDGVGSFKKLLGLWHKVSRPSPGQAWVYCAQLGVLWSKLFWEKHQFRQAAIPLARLPRKWSMSPRSLSFDSLVFPLTHSLAFAFSLPVSHHLAVRHLSDNSLSRL